MAARQIAARYIQNLEHPTVLVNASCLPFACSAQRTTSQSTANCLSRKGQWVKTPSPTTSYAVSCARVTTLPDNPRARESNKTSPESKQNPADPPNPNSNQQCHHPSTAGLYQPSTNSNRSQPTYRKHNKPHQYQLQSTINYYRSCHPVHHQRPPGYDNLHKKAGPLPTSIERNQL